MKKLKSLLVTLAILLCAISASAHDFEVDGIYYRITDSEKLTVAVTYQGSSYSEYSNEYTGSVVIPETVTYDSKTYSVTSIGCDAFRYCRSLTSVTIPNSVTSIGNRAFEGCNSLTSVTIGDGVTSIGNRAFECCSSLTSITIGDGVTSIGEEAFNECSSLTSVHISDISAWCNIKFGCVESNPFLFGVGSNPLYYAKHLYMNGKEITELVIPDGVTTIGNYAFSGCSSLTSVTIPNSVTSIGDFAFYGCDALESVKVLAETPPFANDNTFSNYEIELCVPEKSISVYQTTNPWSNFKSIRALTDEETGISNVQVLPVEVQANNGTIIVTGADDGTMVEVFDISGTKLGEAKTTFNTATINTEAQSGSVVIVKVGNKAIKIKI